MSESKVLLQEEITVSGNPDTVTYIQRCPHDEENPYVQISRDLIRDVKISPECRWMIIYFLSMKDKWKVNMRQLITYLKPHMGRDKVYALMNEAIESGYIKREELKISQGKGKLITKVNFFVSEKPKFKKCFRHPDFQDTDIQDTENTEVKERTSLKKEHIEDLSSLKVPMEPSAIAGEECVSSSIKEKVTIKFSDEVNKITEQMIEILQNSNPVYRLPKDMNKFKQEVQEMLEKDKQTPENILRIFAWACQDTEQRGDFKGWQSVVCSNKRKRKDSNPVEIFRGHISTIYSQMNSRVPRKFAPCSDQKRGLEALKEMEARTI